MIPLLVAYPKSGMTWTRMLINSLMRGGEPIDMDAVPMGALATYRAWIDNQLMLDTMDLPREAWDRVRGLAVRALDGDPTQPIRLLTTHEAHDPERTAVCFPPEVTGPVIYLVRNPLSIAPSYAAHMNVDLDMAVTHLQSSGLTLSSDPLYPRGQFPLYLGHWSDHGRSWLDSGLPVKVVRYEDLLHDGPATLTAIADFLGVPHTPKVIHDALANHAFDRLKQREAKRGYLGSSKQGRFFRKGRSDGWREELTDERIKRLLQAHGDEMNRYGYDPTSALTSSPKS